MVAAAAWLAHAIDDLGRGFSRFMGIPQEAEQARPSAAPHITDGHPKEGHVYFFSVGDFGVAECEAAFNKGELEKDGGIGNRGCKADRQSLVAQAMERLAAGLHPQFVLSLGDNFYVRGVRDLEDKQFANSFEDVYNIGALADVPWRISLGDHDHRGNVDALLLHSGRSKRWNLPSPYYTFQVPVPPGAGAGAGAGAGGAAPYVDVVVADSVGLEGGVEGEALLEGRRFGKEYTDKFAGAAAGAKHWEWLDQALREGSPVLRVVAAHRPVVSMVDRGRSAAEGEVEGRLRARLREAAADTPVLYVNGHDHAMQVLEESDAKVHYLVNGVGGMGTHNFKSEDAPGAPADVYKWGASGVYGFAVHELGPRSLATHFVDASGGRVLFSQEVKF